MDQDMQHFLDSHDILDDEVTSVDNHAHEGFVPSTIPYWNEEFQHGTIHTDVRNSLRQIEDDERRLSTHADFISHWSSLAVQQRLGNGLGRNSNQRYQQMLQRVTEILEKYPGLASDIQSQSSYDFGALQRSVLDDLKIDVEKIRDENASIARHHAQGREALQRGLAEMDKQRDDFEANLVRFKRIESELNDAQAQMSAVRNQNLILTAQKSDDQRNISQIEARLKDSESQSAVLRQVIEAKNSQLSSLEHTQRQHEQKVRTLELQRTQDGHEIARLTEVERLAALTVDKQRETERQLRDAELESKDLEIQHQNDIENLQSHNKELLKTMEALKDEQQKFSELQIDRSYEIHAEVNGLKLRLMQAESDKRNEQAENDRLQSLISRLRSTVLDSQSSYDTLLKKVSPLEEEIIDNRQRAKEARDEIAQQNSRVAHLHLELTNKSSIIDGLTGEINRQQETLARFERDLILSREINSLLIQENEDIGKRSQAQIASFCKLVCQDNSASTELISSEELLLRYVDAHSTETNLELRDTPRGAFTVIYGLAGTQDDVETSIRPVFRLLASKYEDQKTLNPALIDRCADAVNEAGPQIRRLLLSAICAYLQFSAETVVGSELERWSPRFLLLLRSIELLSLWLTEKDWGYLQLSTLLERLVPQELEQQPLVRAMYCMIDFRMREKQETSIFAMLKHVARPGRDVMTFDHYDLVRHQNALVIITEKDEIIFVPRNRVNVLVQYQENGTGEVNYRLVFEDCPWLGSWSTCWKALATSEAHLEFARFVAPLIATHETEGI